LRAIKIIKKRWHSKEQMADLINEVECIRKLDHPNILKIYEYFLDNDNFYICSEVCEGGELFDYIVKK